MIVSLAFVIVLLEGCYYVQAFNGQMEVLRKRRPVSEVISDESTDAKLRERLEMVQEARQFAVDQLLLPENDSYRSYSDLGREYVVWNIFAAPEFSLTPKTWCYPIAGCVAYRGYFSQQKAEKKALRLGKDGYDVFVGGVAAYSTLGRFDDPVLNTMMRWTDTTLVQTLFHELAHQKLYVSGDTAFNESFATAAAEFGMQRWRAHQGLQQSPENFEQYNTLSDSVSALVAAVRTGLEKLYASDLAADKMRSQKEMTLSELAADVQVAIDSSGLQVQNRWAPPLNNARLASVAVYEGNLPAFRNILAACNDDLACFYKKSAELAELSSDARKERLNGLAES